MNVPANPLATPARVQRELMTLGHRQRGLRAQVWRGGPVPGASSPGRPPVLLLHGAWSGARAHWSPVWEHLAERHVVVAPELPGVMSGSGERQATYGDLADWVDEVLACAGCGPVVAVGNALGATVAWHLAARNPFAVSALVMVDGLPSTDLPAWQRWAWLKTPLRRRALAQLRREVHGASALDNGFFDPARAPAEVRAELATPDDDRLSLLLDLRARTLPVAAPPSQPTLVVWGANDRLPGADAAAGRQFQAGLPGSRFASIDEAGHMPQVEQPQRFIDVLEGFIGGLPSFATAPGAAAARQAG